MVPESADACMHCAHSCERLCLICTGTEAAARFAGQLLIARVHPRIQARVTFLPHHSSRIHSSDVKNVYCLLPSYHFLSSLLSWDAASVSMSDSAHAPWQRSRCISTLMTMQAPPASLASDNSHCIVSEAWEGGIFPSSVLVFL